MLHLETFTFNPFSENTYIVYNDDKKAVIIDPGMFNDYERKSIDKFIADNQLNLISIINTHTHIDHIFGVDYMKNTYNVPFLIHEKDQILLDHSVESAKRFGIPFQTVPAVDEYLTETYFIGDEELKILFTPGHSPGSVSFYYEPAKWVISGDVLFNRSIGRTDLPLGDFDVLKVSIESVLYSLPDEVMVHSGHGMPTCIGEEKYMNPFVKVSE